MSQQQQTLMFAIAIMLAFFMAGGAALCGGRPADDGLSSLENDPEFQQMQADWAEMKANRAARGRPVSRLAGGQHYDQADAKGAAETEARVAGAYYPDEHEQEESGGFDPLLIAVLGGGLVFGLAGAGAFLMLGRGAAKEEEAPAPAEPSEEEWASNEGGFDDDENDRYA